MVGIFWSFVTSKNTAKEGLMVMLVVAAPERFVMMVAIFGTIICFGDAPNTGW